jgi:hypothetical protein
MRKESEQSATAWSVPSKRFAEWGKWYQRITLILVLFSMILFALSALLVRSVTAAPEALIVFSVYYLSYHALHAGYGIFRLLQFLFVVKKRRDGVKIAGTAVSIVFTPVSALFAYLAVIFLALSSCAA